MKLFGWFLVFLNISLFTSPLVASELSSAKSRLVAWQQLINDNKDVSDWQKLNTVNQFFNQVTYVDDKSQWGVDDYWATPRQFLLKNAGDCEDYAIAKYFTLKLMGVSVERMRITYGNLLPSQQAHMVLVYFEGAAKTPLVLDNLSQTITAFSQRLDLDPVYSFNHNGLWLASRSAKKSQFIGSTRQVSYWKALSDKFEKEQVF